MSTTAPVNLLDFDLPGLVAWFESIGEKPFRARQVMRWLHHFGADDFGQMTDLAKTLRAKLEQLACITPPILVAGQDSADGTRKWALGVDSPHAHIRSLPPEGAQRLSWGGPATSVGPNNRVETVFIPDGDRGTLCVSTQVGCALECRFCSTGQQGFNRNLTTAEIIGQLWWANRAMGRDPKGDRLISNVVMMGMGEPLLNYDNTVRALNIMLDDHAYGLSRRRVTVSTSGIVPAMDRLGQDCPVALAVSLHAPNDRLRDELVPINRKYPLKELMAACQRYLAFAPRDFITFEYVMLDGINDSDAHARELIALTREVSCKFNLIPFNPFPNTAYKRSPATRVREFAARLQAAGIVTTTRKTRGEDIDAACGQLAGKVIDRSRRVERRLSVV